jgi:hypothetical protein
MIPITQQLTQRGAVSYSIPLPAEAIVEVIPTVENEVNLVRSSVALVRYDQESVVVNYHLYGPRKEQPGNCLNPGRADIVVNIVTDDYAVYK